MKSENRVELNAEEFRQKILLETGRLSWSELARHFARGLVVIVHPPTDLIEAAAAFGENDQTRVENWISEGRITRALDADAMRWDAADQQFWAVVVAPWVLVQEITDQE